MAEVLELFGNQQLKYHQEAKATDWFPGISMPGRSNKPSIDILVARPQPSGSKVPKAIVSCKWSIRHDRISDPTNECVQYKRASIGSGFSATHLLYGVVTSEMDHQRIAKLVDQECVDFVAHTHLPLFAHLNGTPKFPGHANVIDLTDLVRLTKGW